MKRLPLVLILLLFVSLIINGNTVKQATGLSNIDTFAKYRDTIIGNFTGLHNDTLICEPLDTTPMEGTYFIIWRIRSNNKQIPSIQVNNVFPLKFTTEGDLDGNGTDEVGFLKSWPYSTWEVYCALTLINGQWNFLIEPQSVWEDHLTDTLSTKDLIKPYNEKYVKVKFSTSRYISDTEDVDFCVIDTLIKINTYAITKDSDFIQIDDLAY